MNFTEEETDGVHVLGITGGIHIEASAELSKKLNILIDQRERHLLLDFSGVDYINSSGLRALMVAARNLNDHSGEIALAAVTEAIEQILRVSGCTSHVTIHSSREEARKALKG